MSDIAVAVAESGDGWTAAVTVTRGGGSTRHRVTVSREVYERLTGGACTPEELVRESFAFLLEREAKESILREFEITVSSRYFPEYEGEIGRRLGG